MIPSVLAHQLRKGVEDFLHTTFPVSTPYFHGIFDRLIENNQGIFKGPYLSVQLPFKTGASGADYFSDVPMRFSPYLHQEKTFQRLSGRNLKSTIVATGTGSGKTESFLFPIMNHCYQNRGERGIKAILIYPMNALASDQALRIAQLIDCNDKLQGQVTAGLFIGQSEKEPHVSMGSDHIITNKDVIRNNPPDILLTNYKMLDYLLIRPEDYPLWIDNGEETLRFLVVDELHTFDGAQGTDLACLIRRLKSRLKMPDNFLCCIGTSATLGGKEELKSLQAYAAEIFGESFDDESIITEYRQSAGEFFEKSMIIRSEPVPEGKLDSLNPYKYSRFEDYIIAQVELWFGETIKREAFYQENWKADLADHLKSHSFFQNVIKLLKGKILSFEDLFYDLDRYYPSIKNGSDQYRHYLLISLLSLVSMARKVKGDYSLPFLDVRLQSWIRELRRMVGNLSNTEKPEIRFSDDLKTEKLKKHLPLVHCRECNAMGWGGLKRQADTQINSDLQSFYTAFFQKGSQLRFLFPEPKNEHKIDERGEYQRICGNCLNLTTNLTTNECPKCYSDELIRVFIPENNQRKSHHCPYCGGKNSLTIIGSRAASLTSVLIAQLYSSNFNDDKKLITFSDSVQDAAHRAGFFTSRTYRFNFRAALQQFILNCSDDKLRGLNLTTLPEAFSAFWSEKMDEKSFITTFLAPDMAWFHEYEELKKTGQLQDGNGLFELVKKRIGWEITSEYGFRSRIGRTLEKTASSVAVPDSEKIDKAIAELHITLKNKIGVFRQLDTLSVRRFIEGFLIHMKNQGAVFHEGLGLYLSEMGSTFLHNKKMIWMARFGMNSRTPSFLTTKKTGNFDCLVSSKRGRTWYEGWAGKCFSHVSPYAENAINEILEICLKQLAQDKLIEERTIKGERVWGILPESCSIERNVAVICCEKCGHEISVAKESVDLWTDFDCQRFVCTGVYKQKEITDDYYAGLYANGDIKRIFSAEHTGLLVRDEREILEKKFKAKEQAPWDPNLLSCTPTLEMGIDIGDLSSLILCSVPPGQANYLQRIGRAGRKDGNSLNFTVANGRPHDLYFFSDPYLMISGNVETPGIFLNASAVLERQFTAFCFDRWVESGINKSAIPDRLRQIFPKLSKNDSKSFPYNFVNFIDLNRIILFNDFLKMFEGNLSPESINHLTIFTEGDNNTKGSLSWKIIDGLNFLLKDRESLKKKSNALTRKIREMEKSTARDQNYEEELKELQREQASFRKLVTQINDRQTLNFFTDEGLLPNYAFPEAGVTLRSIIYRRKTRVQEGESNYDTVTYDYERGAVSAISELAPENSFYADGRKVCIDQVNIDLSEIQTWQMCNNCSYLALTGTISDLKTCPSCGSSMWSDANQKRQMLRMRQVIATTSDKESRITDDSDDREPKFYNKQMLVGVNTKDIREAYRIDSELLPFGFEFLSKADFREINFGEKGDDGEKVTIAGKELVRNGFVICRYCGKVKPKKGEFRHSLTCTARWKESDTNFTECVYLYREFSSEAIRILLPVTAFDGSEKKLHSFIAAIHMGLKTLYGGNIDHLQTSVQDEPSTESNHRKKYLLLYDTVPGGTGYLKELMRSEEPLMQVFEKALELLKNCACQSDPEKDGCYRCLYAYRRSYNMLETSRDCAIELLSEILKYREKLVQTDNLNNVEMNSLFDSELEARFIEMIRRTHSDDKPVILGKQNVNGKPGYFYKVGKMAYNIELQVNLGRNEGVMIPSRGDFVFWPARSSDFVKPVVVFTDGYTWHKDRINKDMAQRRAIAESGKFVVFSLSWNDIINGENESNKYYTNYLNVDETKLMNYNKLLAGYEISGLKWMNETNSFKTFIKYLDQPENEKWGLHAFVHAFLHIDHGRYGDDNGIKNWEKRISESVPDYIAAEYCNLDGKWRYGFFESQDNNRVKIFVAANEEDVRKKRLSGMLPVCILDDEKAVAGDLETEFAWNGFLRLYNLFQFIPGALFTTAHHDEEARLLTDSLHKSGSVKAILDENTEGWNEIKTLVDPEYHSIIDNLQNKGFSIPEVGYELQNNEGEIVAEVELAWPDLKTALFTPEQIEFKPVFEAFGWTLSIITEDFKKLETEKLS